MNNIIRRIEINGFRSLDTVQIICDRTNVFTGLNDVGKSNILRALNLFFNGKTDLNQDFNFSADYSKLSLSKAQKSSKKKQQIKIKLYFNTPPSFKSLRVEELWVERTYDRLGNLSERSSLDDSSKKRASLTRLVNSIRYYYIPAQKGISVLEYILGEIGKRNLMSQSEIIELNQKVNNNIKDFAGILGQSSIDIRTSFELPVLVEDFWQRLNINTEFEEFNSLNDGELTSGDDGVKLREEAYQISLLARGEGLKSKYIPPLLKWIQEHEPSKYFVWGIDEPENSLEFKKAQEVADLYFNEYSKNTQLFLTSHSLSFIFPSENRDDTTIFRCIKTGKGDISVLPMNDLFAEQTKSEIAEELGALEVQKRVIVEWRQKEEEFKKIKTQFHLITRPIIYVEGASDKEYWDLMKEVFDKNSDSKFEIRPVGTTDVSGSEQGMGRSGLDKVWQLRHQSPQGKRIVLFYDVDCRKQTEQDGDIVLYCPERLEERVYENGIEHLIDLPESFCKEEYQIIKAKGDNKTYTPDKNKIKDFILNLDPPSQRAALKRLNEIYDELVRLYL